MDYPKNFDWRSDLLLEQERLQELQSASDAFSALQPAFDERLQEALQPAFDWRSDLLLEQERLQELQSASDAFSVTERLQEALQPAFDWRSDLLLEQERLQELQSASDAFSVTERLQEALQPAFSAQERLQEALQPAFDWRSDLLLEQERLQAALKPAFDVEERLQDAARVVELIEYNHERAMHATRETARMLSAQEDAARVVELIEYNHERAMLNAERTLSEHSRLVEMLAFDEDRNRQAVLNAERTLSASIQASQELQPMMHERMASLIEGTEFAQERKQRMLLEREEDTDEEFTELHSLDESQWVEVIKFAQQKNRYSKIEIVKGRVVNTAWTLTPSVCFELIKLLISDGDQQLIYLMEKIKDLPVEEISKVLEEIYKNIGGFLL